MGLTTLRLAMAALFLVLSSGAQADQTSMRPKAVVELFTSQGCNSCPPADELLAELARSGEVVALAYHVNYWDYLGWRDTMATPDNTGRQYDYNRQFGNRSVYTPQAVINGREHVNGAKRYKVEGAMERLAASAKGMKVDVNAHYTGNTLVIETSGGAAGPGGAQILLVYFRPVTPVEIERGENKGRTVTYWNAVSGFHSAGMWHGKASRIELPLSEVYKKGAGGCAVLIQEMGKNGLPGAILGATIINRPSS
ncbi:DUF1223 domain-containing protein [Aquamicrobium sp. LC103]|uniref:DUF1223 domain-containing protein n=1 Tax=Aquamicrobium sp. LC103 TaxID=1120658 RepID=UPI000AFA671E|nr:DUF1223 domain-containing protein [Aquamicrobium sp. LC103]TKT83051.1 DUF1223 domain-containing protein [Aquamicrobium sp. LC103]